MSNSSVSLPAPRAANFDPARAARARARHRSETRFKAYGIFAIAIAFGALIWLLTAIIAQGYSAFTQSTLTLSVHLDPEVIDPQGTRTPAALNDANYTTLVRQALYQRFPAVTERGERRLLGSLVSSGADTQLRNMVRDDPSLIGTTQTVSVIAAAPVDMFVKGHTKVDQPENVRGLSDAQLGWVQALERDGSLGLSFNWRFFSSGDSREPEMAGIWGAVVGSFLTMLVTLALTFPIGVASAIYLEEFAPKNRWTDIIEVNINNLAAVPSIVFGLLGLAVFLNFFGLPRSAPLAGGMVLALMSLPTIIIATRAALRAVPPSIREGALGVGASRLQVVTHHVFPLAMPGTLTGTIIAMAQALGETAPLLMIGMVAFIVDVPGGFTDPATVLPVQIFLWSDLPERAFVERTSAAIIILLGFLVLMNLAAVLLRKRFERRW